MFTNSLILTSLLALSASAAPTKAINAAALEARQDTTFNIEVYNNCDETKSFAIYGVSSTFEMTAYSTPVDISPGSNAVIAAPYTATGLRLSGHAEWGTAGQWEAQALFEFGYSAWGSVEGTAYDLSNMLPNSDSDISMSVEPIDNGSGSASCTSFTCLPWDPLSLTLDQCWTNADQVDSGSPADTVCYEGMTDFKVTWCPVASSS